MPCVLKSVTREAKSSSAEVDFLVVVDGRNKNWSSCRFMLHPFRVQEFCLMTGYPGPLGRAVEWHPFRVLRQAEGLQVHSPGQRPGYKRGEKLFRTL